MNAKRWIVTILTVLAMTSGVMASWVEVYSINGPQDNLDVPRYLDELGTSTAFPEDERIELIQYQETSVTACSQDPGDDPDIPNMLVTIRNLTNTTWEQVWYVADPGVWVSNYDGWIGNIFNYGDHEHGFLIDNSGFNRPLVFESFIMDNKFQPNETWRFILQDYSAPPSYPPPAFGSVGITSNSGSIPPGTDFSTGSLIALVPEPATMAVLSIGGLVMLRRRKK